MRPCPWLPRVAERGTNRGSPRSIAPGGRPGFSLGTSGAGAGAGRQQGERQQSPRRDGGGGPGATSFPRRDREGACPGSGSAQAAGLCPDGVCRRRRCVVSAAGATWSAAACRRFDFGACRGCWLGSVHATSARPVAIGGQSPPYRSTKSVACGGQSRPYRISMASPKLNRRYRSAIACRYADWMRSTPASAITSAINVLRGQWKFVNRPSTARKR